MTWKEIVLHMRRDGALPVGFAARIRPRVLLQATEITAAAQKAHEPELLAVPPAPQPLQITWNGARL